MLPKYIELILLCIFVGSNINIVNGLHAEAMMPSTEKLSGDHLNLLNEFLTYIERGGQIEAVRKYDVRRKSTSRNSCFALQITTTAVLTRNACVLNLLPSPDAEYDDLEVQRLQDKEVFQIREFQKLANDDGVTQHDLLRVYLTTKVPMPPSDSGFVTQLEFLEYQDRMKSGLE